MITHELSEDALDALPVGAVVVPVDASMGFGATFAGWRKVYPPGPNGPWQRIDGSVGVVTTRTSTLAMIGVMLKEVQK